MKTTDYTPYRTNYYIKMFGTGQADFLQDYTDKKKDIKKRLRNFRHIYKKTNRDIFSELCFCILTPQSKAVICDEAIRRLQRKDLLFKGSKNRIRHYLKGVRFPNNKARYIIAARNIDIKSKLNIKDLHETRDWLVKNVKGLGYKEASHFLRNIGLGKDMAILDRHILKNLRRYGIIRKIPSSLTRKAYMDIETKMRKFFKNIGIPMEEVDLLFWSKETGFVFK